MRSLAALLALMMIITRLNGSPNRSQTSHHFSQYRNTSRLRNGTGLRHKPEYHQENYMRPEASMQSRIKKIENCPEGLCEEAEDYPMDDIKKFLEEKPKLREYFKGVDKLPEIGNRYPFEEEPLCTVTTKTVFPRTTQNLNQETITIINQENYQQGVVYDLCGSEKKCRYTENFPENMVATCKQKYTVRKVLVYDKNNSSKVFDDIRVPSCCVCMIQTRN